MLFGYKHDNQYYVGISQPQDDGKGAEYYEYGPYKYPYLVAKDLFNMDSMHIARGLSKETLKEFCNLLTALEHTAEYVLWMNMITMLNNSALSGTAVDDKTLEVEYNDFSF